jgi:TRAP transporter TAXI family solute receptor
MASGPASRPARFVAAMRRATLRELLLFILPALALVAVAFAVTVRFIKPAPPGSLVISTGAPDGAYHRFAERYRDILARDGVTLELKPSAGSVDNLARLKDDEAGVDVGFVQGGLGMLTLTPLAQPADETTLYSLANLFFEPVWVFHQARREVRRLSDLAGLRVAVGPQGSGTRKVALELLAAHGVDAKTAQLADLGGTAAIDALAAGQLDAVFLIAAPEAPVVRHALALPDLAPADLDNTPALSRRFPYLKPVVLARGVFDLKADLPRRDIRMVATQANLVIREDLHPALAYLLLEAAAEIHGTPGLFHQPGEFPTPVATDWPLADEAQRYFKSGRPFLQRYLPFWLANLVERMLVLLVPLLAVVVPVFKWLPALFAWRQHAKINRWYGELKFLERDVASRTIEGDELAKTLDRLDAIERDAARLAIPLQFADRVYTLRQHIDYVRARLTGVAAAPPAEQPSAT